MISKHIVLIPTRADFLDIQLVVVKGICISPILWSVLRLYLRKRLEGDDHETTRVSVSEYVKEAATEKPTAQADDSHNQKDEDVRPPLHLVLPGK